MSLQRTEELPWRLTEHAANFPPGDLLNVAEALKILLNEQAAKKVTAPCESALKHTEGLMHYGK